MLFRKIQAQQSNYKSNKLYKIHKTRQKTNGIAVRLIKCNYKESTRTSCRTTDVKNTKSIQISVKYEKRQETD